MSVLDWGCAPSIGISLASSIRALILFQSNECNPRHYLRLMQVLEISFMGGVEMVWMLCLNMTESRVSTEEGMESRYLGWVILYKKADERDPPIKCLLQVPILLSTKFNESIASNTLYPSGPYLMILWKSHEKKADQVCGSRRIIASVSR